MKQIFVEPREAASYALGENIIYEDKPYKVAIIRKINHRLRITLKPLTACDQCDALHDMAGQRSVRCSCGSYVT